jgi:sugar diacid utilization regulator
LLSEIPHPPTDVSVSSDLLEYDLTAWHLAVIVDEERSAIEAVAPALAAKAGTAAWIALELGPRTTSIWLGRSEPWESTDRQAVLDALRARGLRASVGDPAYGPEGLRETYRDVEAIERVRAAWGDAGPRLLTFADVQLETLLLTEPDDLTRFVHDELGRLAEQSEEMARLRETIVAWYETGSNVSAANALGLHEHTVRNRLRRAESLLGHALSTRRLELRSALRMLRAAGSDVATSPDQSR